ncbi:MAG: hypothetical protein HZA54_08150 [Planctomycetes bacterium]|nr:hypothetical protein [Planctomycetota bacterium]
MNAAQLHLALNHLPGAALVFSLPFLAWGLTRKAQTALLLGLWLLVAGAVTAIPAYVTGEPAEELVEGRAGVTHALIEEHEEAAEVALPAALVVGVVAGIALALAHRGHARARTLAAAAFGLAVVTTALFVRTGHLGGLIRHDELRAGVAPEGAGGSGPAPGGEHDDDGERGHH